MSIPTITKRVDRVLEQMKSADLDALFLSSAESMGYFQGLFESGHERFMLLAIRSTGDIELICPALTANQARRHGVSNIRSWADGESAQDLFAGLSLDWNLRTAVIGIEGIMRSDQLLVIQDTLPAALFRNANDVIGGVMRQKDAEEVALLKATGQQADEVFEWILPQLKAGLTERQVAGLIQSEFLRRGASGSFCIAATGPASAEPHHMSDDTVIQRGDCLILDFGCTLDHYQSDITRTVSMGPASDEMKRVYEVVYAAHHASRRAVKVGESTGNVDRAGREEISNAGYGEYFVHRTGHGIGIRGHEEPYIAPGSEVVLLQGDAFSIEPGIYLPGKFGVRLENIVTCGTNGLDCESMNAEFSPTIVEV